MFIVFLRFAANKAEAGRLMDAHNDWLKQGFDAGVFLIAGSLAPAEGGAIVAHGTTRDALERRVGRDPFVAENVVRAEIIEVAPGRTDDRLSFLLA